jgi:exopolysaccharide biosynthesis polyprenyl glycosylphosphotransferase
MTVAQRLAWLETLSTVGILTIATGVAMPATTTGTTWNLVARAGLVAAVCLVSLYFNDLYDADVPHRGLAELFGRLCRALGWSAFILAATYVVFPETIIPGNLASHALITLLVVMLVSRATVYTLAKRAPFSERVVIMGSGSLAIEIGRQIGNRPDLPLRLVGFLTEPVAAGLLPAPRLGSYHHLEAVVRRYGPDRIIVAIPERRGHLPLADLLACRARGVRIEEGAQAFERLTRRLAAESLIPSALIIAEGFRVTPGRLFLKRVLSAVIAFTGLGLTAPLMALIALLIKLDSSGPVFFIHERVGLFGRPFKLIKFRTMREASEAPSEWVRDNEARITRVGKWLRAFRLDELPQLINILRGDMGLVGPRPHPVSNLALFRQQIPYYSLRCSVRPGLTGWAQIRYGYSNGLEEEIVKMCYDLYYIKHMSLRFDLYILFDTLKFVLSGKRPG